MDQFGDATLAVGTWVGLTPEITAYRTRRFNPNIKAPAPPPPPTPQEVVEFPYELPRFSQKTLQQDPRLAAWNQSHIDWWEDVRKRLHRKIGPSGDGSVTLNITQIVNEIQELKRIHNVVNKFFRSSNIWVWKHNRGAKPIVSVHLYFTEHTTAEFEQIDSPDSNTTTIRWGSNYSGEATYAFPTKLET